MQVRRVLYYGDTAAALPSLSDSQTDCQSIMRPATTARAAGSSAPRCSATLGQPGRFPESASESQIDAEYFREACLRSPSVEARRLSVRYWSEGLTSPYCGQSPVDLAHRQGDVARADR